MPDDMEISDLIQKKFMDDDPAALELIYEHFGARLYGYVLSLVKSPSDSEEILNELFIRIAQKCEIIGKAMNMRVYLFAMARNMAYEMFRKRSSQKKSLSEYTVYLTCGDDVHKWSDEELTAVRKAVDELSEEQREVVILRIFEEMAFDEIAQLMRISQNTAASRYRYALEKLRRRLKGFGYE